MSDVALQIELNSGSSVNALNNVIFDTITYSNGNISYNSTTGIITFNEAGRYEINWWVATQSSQATDGASFALSSSKGDFLVGASPIKKGEVVGIGIIDVVTAPVTLSLVNSSNATYFYAADVPLKASLIVVEDDIGPTGDTGPTGATGDTGPTGDVGPTGPGAIIPFASGSIAILTTALGGVPGTQVLLAFGTNALGTLSEGVIDIAGFSNMAFSMPRDGTITSIAAYLSIGAPVDLTGSTVTITAQLYSSATPDDSFYCCFWCQCNISACTYRFYSSRRNFEWYYNGSCYSGNRANSFINGVFSFRYRWYRH